MKNSHTLLLCLLLLMSPSCYAKDDTNSEPQTCAEELQEACPNLKGKQKRECITKNFENFSEKCKEKFEPKKIGSGKKKKK